MAPKPPNIMETGRTGVIFFVNTPSGIHHVLWITGIDLDLDPQHHFPPGLQPPSPQGQQGRRGAQITNM